MRILLGVNNPSAHLFPLPNGWADRGHAVDVLMDAPDGRFGHAREYTHAGVRLLTLSRDGSVLDAVTGETMKTSLAELLEPTDAVVIGGYATRVGRRILRCHRSPRSRMVLLAERPIPRGLGPKRWVRDAWARWVVDRVDAVWSMSETGDHVFARLGKAPEARIPYPIEVRPATTSRAEEWHGKWSTQHTHRVMVLGQLVERKRPLAALTTIERLLDSGFSVHADFAGSGRLAPKVSVAARELPVTLHGHVAPPMVDRLFSGSHLLLHPASHDGWGMAVVEAASRGVPVVATAGCDAATELAARTCSVRVTGGSPSEMAQAARDLIEAFRSDPVTRSLDLVRAVEQVCGADRIVERSLDALASGGADGR